ncbi:serine hydrolase domain-containing protein [Nonomuraea endophytica]|uniref:CubicO group peptidase (Beta-lactamase class C family) n=1 Tax=Nonomuraea endophytica TaxID=714136 RepID=A0A7W8EKB4_9ACTN|nr:serine hydrolase domain-containing protein [Nonomuraea endophytica]MBB5084055.1 CubicO group peptidase (beta-lactamase class C family) [Nonomuraea endophytica]
MPTVPSRRSILGLLGAAPVAVAGVFTTAGSAGADDAVRRLPRDLLPGGRFDRFVAERGAAGQFSGTILVAYRGKPVLTRSHGLADEARKVANDTKTSFDLASMTKSYTAVAIARLAQEGKLAFHEKLGAYLDGFPADVAKVTLHQLLTHTSGAGRPGQTNQRPPGEEEWDSEDDVWRGMTSYLRTLPLRFTPGTQYGYSNDGYFILGEVVAKVSGQSYYDYVRRHVFTRAGLTDTDFYTRPAVRADRGIAHGYMTQPSGERVDITTTPWLPYIGSPYHGAFSSAPDILRFATALHDNRLLSPAYTRIVTSGKHALGPADRPAVDGEIQFYGYGHTEAVTATRRVVGHSGSGPGRATNLDVFPDAGLTVIVLSNHDTSVKPIVALARQLATPG